MANDLITYFRQIKSITMSNQASSKNGGTIALIILLVGSLGFNVYQWSSKGTMKESYETKVDSLNTEQANVEKELNDTYADLNQYKGINSRLDSLLQEANGKVDEQKAKIEKLIRNGQSTAQLNEGLKKQLEELKTLRSNYMERIDSLLVENEQLKKEKVELNSTVENLSKNLETTVNAASIIKAEYFKVTSYKHRSGDKYSETAMAKRTNKLEACFSVMDNAIAKSGPKTVYLRMMEPGGKVLGNPAEGSSTFHKTGSDEDMLFTISQSIDYNNKKQDLCLKYEEKERVFVTGTYMIEVYVDGNLAGVSSVSLK